MTREEFKELVKNGPVILEGNDDWEIGIHFGSGP